MNKGRLQNDTGGVADGPAAIDVVFLDIDGVLLPFDPAEDSSDEEDRVPCFPPLARKRPPRASARLTTTMRDKRADTVHFVWRRVGGMVL